MNSTFLVDATARAAAVAAPTPKLLQRINATQELQQANAVVIGHLGDSMGYRTPQYIYDTLRATVGLKGLAMDSLTLAVGAGVTAPPTNTGAPENFDWWTTGKYVALDAGENVDYADTAAGSIGYIRCDRITIYSVAASGSGTFKVQTSPDGSIWTDVASIGTINSDNGSTAAGVVSTGSVTRAFQRIRVLGVSGTVNIIGAKIWDSTVPGVIICGMHRGGMTFAQQTQALPAVFDPIAADLAPDHLIMEQKDNLGDYTDGITDTVAMWTAAGATPEWTIVGTTDGQANDTTTAAIRVETEAVARALDLYYFDANASIGGWAGITSMGWEDPDAIHLDDDAHRAIATRWLTDTGVLNSQRRAFGFRRSTTGSDNDIVFSQPANDTRKLTFKLETGAKAESEIMLGNNSGATTAPLWYLRRFASTDANYPNALQLGGGTNNDGRLLFDESGRALLFQTGTGATAFRLERLQITESSQSYSCLLLHHEHATPTGKALRVTKNDDAETAFIRANGSAKLTLPTYADDAAAGVGGLTAGELYITSGGVVMGKL